MLIYARARDVIAVDYCVKSRRAGRAPPLARLFNRFIRVYS